MQMNMLVLIFLLAPVTVLAARQDAPRPGKVLTQEQQAYQQESRKVSDERNRLRTEAKQAFDAEITREKAGDCPDARTTLDLNICLGNEGDATAVNYKAYVAAIRSMLGLKRPAFSGSKEQPPQIAVAGPVLTQEQLVAEFDKVEESWKSYRDAQCTAAFHQMGGGTEGPSAEVRCELSLTRGHMRELDSLYNLMLYH